MDFSRAVSVMLLAIAAIALSVSVWFAVRGPERFARQGGACGRPLKAYWLHYQRPWLPSVCSWRLDTCSGPQATPRHIGKHNMELDMSTPKHATRAVSLLTAVGYQSTTASKRHGPEERVVLRVSACTDYGVTEAQRLINAVDPNAQPLS